MVRTYTVDLYFSGFITVEVDAESKERAIIEADRQYRDGELEEEMKNLDILRWEECDEADES